MKLSKAFCISKDCYHGRIFYHKKEKNADGSRLRARVNGQVKTWKTRPQEFRLPMKYGLKECFYITQDNCHEWDIMATV